MVSNLNDAKLFTVRTFTKNGDIIGNLCNMKKNHKIHILIKYFHHAIYMIITNFVEDRVINS